MPSIHSLLPKLVVDFPQITFLPGELFSWSPSRQTVFYNEADPTNVELFLHELSHGLLDHRRYSRDVELLAMEAAAWNKALELAKGYKVVIIEDDIEDNLDTYRDWMHARSSCPTCEAIGYQTEKDTYHCVACAASWRVNEARLCGLKRYSLKK
ncbi:MAG: hypothetical protein ABIP50_04245 [Candidatus Saccharimonadales bacterium]